ncbi:biotin/lipoyl-containing protein [Marinilabilia sp.]|uniref:biotin/lipoyl-containing protein n=1 Tax=Marinilabilia sp. TaxID=2021252 RepID=UPI0025C70080|nr:biotin/lipoyl-containing protein [Marinilabilia sp.]
MKKFDFSINGNKYHVHIKDIDDDIASVEVNGTSYSVELQQEMKKVKTPKLVRQEVKPKPGEGHIVKKSSTGEHQILAPLPGSIFKMLVKVGDEVKKGDTLLVMEAMKMENNVMSDKDGTVKEIKVKEGDSVLQSDVLLTLE